MKSVCVVLMGLSLMFLGCSSSGSGSDTDTSLTQSTTEEESSSEVTQETNTTQSVNSAPLVLEANVSKVFMEYDGSDTYSLLSNVSDVDGNDTLSVVSVVQLDGNSSLPALFSLDDGNISVTPSLVDVADGKVLLHEFNVTVGDGDVNVSYILSYTINDSANDIWLTYSLSMADVVESNATMGISLVLVDSDGLSGNTLSFEILDRNDSNVSVYTGILADNSAGDGNFSVSLDLLANSIGAGYYTFSAVVSPVVGGENPQGDVRVVQDFQVLNTPPTWTASSYDTGLTVEDRDDNPIVIMDLASVSNDVDGDAITYTVVSVNSSVAPLDEPKLQNSLYVENGILKIHNLMTNDPNSDAIITVTVKAEAIGGSNNTDVVFIFNNVQ